MQLSLSWGEQMKLIRCTVAYSQREWAKYLEVSNRTISAWETGNSLPTAKKHADIINRLKMLEISDGIIESLRSSYAAEKLKISPGDYIV